MNSEKDMESDDNSKTIKILMQELEKAQEKAVRLEQELMKAREKATRLEKEKGEMDHTFSVDLLLKTYGGLPALKRNTAARPSVGGTSSATNTAKPKEANDGTESNANKKRKIFADKGNKICNTNNETELAYLNEASVSLDSLDRKKLHQYAFIDDMEEKVIEYICRFNVNVKQKNGHLVKSSIALKMAENSTNKEAKLVHFNEASVSLHVMDVLHDVLQCLHLASTTQVGQEISIFSMRPDIVVVRWFTTIILVLEVKNPGDDGNKVVQNNRAAGQVFDYAMGLRQMGIDHPFVCLSTYDHMRIGTLQKSSKKIFDEAIRRLGDNGTLVDVNLPVVNQVNNKPTVSPEKEGNLLDIPDDSKPRETFYDNNKIINESQVERVIFFSETFKRDNIFQALYFAIVCGVVSAENSTNQKDSILVPKDGDQIDRCVAVVTESSFRWEKLTCKATYQLKRGWDEKPKVYLHCVLGQGSSGKVYLGSDSVGQMFAVKLYLFDSKIMESFSAVANKIEENRQRESAEQTRNAEAEKWKTFYPDYSAAIRVGDLYQTPFLAMPYVASIPQSHRTRLLDAVEQELQRFADEGFVYSDKDLRWRHIGMRKGEDGNDKIILVDLESMKGKGKDNAMALVSYQIKQLEERARDEYIPIAQPLFHAT